MNVNWTSPNNSIVAAVRSTCTYIVQPYKQLLFELGTHGRRSSAGADTPTHGHIDTRTHGHTAGMWRSEVLNTKWRS